MGTTASRVVEGVSMKLSDFEIELADEFIDDWYGLYEVGWRLNALNFDPDPAARVAVIRKLVEAEVLDVYLANWDSIRTAAPQSMADALEAVSNLANWEPPTPDTANFHLVATNAKGEELIARYIANGKREPHD